MAEGQEKVATGGAKPSPVPPFVQDALDSEWKVRARFVGFQVPKPWEMEGRKGVSYKVDVRVPEGTVLMKVPEEVYRNMQRDNLDFGDHIEIIYGRTVANGEMRVAPVAFHKLGGMA